MKNKCVVCNKKQLTPKEGKVIDGSWQFDRYLIDYKFKWICSWECYSSLLNKVAYNNSELKFRLTKMGGG